MSAYLKLTYDAQTCNTALVKGLIYIGRHCREGLDREDQTDRACLEAGIACVAGRLGKHSKRAVRAMVTPETRTDAGRYCWKIHRQVFPKAYSEILRLLAAFSDGEAGSVYTELLEINPYWGGDSLSDYLIPAQKAVLLAAAGSNRDAAKLLKQIEVADLRIPQA